MKTLKSWYKSRGLSVKCQTFWTFILSGMSIATHILWGEKWHKEKKTCVYDCRPSMNMETGLDGG